jgi:predicted glutamine amidotransferase
MIAVCGVPDLQKDLFSAFKRLSETGAVPATAQTAGHKDGWGISIYDRGQPRYLGRESTDPLKDSGYDLAVEDIGRLHSQIVLGHLRKASCGDNSIENTQPFICSPWSFAHNGTVYSPALNRIGNENDSRAYFRTLVDQLPSSNVETALAAGVKELRRNITHNGDESGQTYSSLTCLLSDGTSIYALRDFSDEAERGYYTMYYSLWEEGIVFCQEKIINGVWEEVPNKTLVVFHPGENVRVVSCD